MHISDMKVLPTKQDNRDNSMWVFIYYKDNTRFTLGYYDFSNEMWFDYDGMPIKKDFVWAYLPVKQMKAFVKEMSTRRKISADLKW